MAKFLDYEGLKTVWSKVKEKDTATYNSAKNYVDSALTSYPKLVDSKIPSTYLPSYVDDVVDGYFYNNNFYSDSSHSKAIAGESGKIYVDIATNKVYRYTGILITMFVEISSSLALGETASTAYAGDKGAANAKNITTLQTDVSGIKTNVSTLQTDVSTIKSNYIKVNNTSSNILGQVYNDATTVGMEISEKGSDDNYVTRSQVRMDEDHVTLGAYNDVYIGYIEKIGDNNQHKFTGISESIHLTGSDGVELKNSNSDATVILSEDNFTIGTSAKNIATKCYGTLTVNGKDVWNSETLTAISSTELDSILV